MLTKQKIVLKIGSSTLTAGSDRISYGKIEDIARQIIKLGKKYQVILVSSGAIATAKQFMNISNNENGKNIDSKQAMAAVGQPKLIRIYDEVFESFGLKAAQCLLTYRDFENKTARENTKNTINKLIEYDYIPIINENDTVAVEEIILGDNDKLSALVANIVRANLLVIATDVDGLYDNNPHLNPRAKLIKTVKSLEQARNYTQEKNYGLGTGGMSSKIEAVKICWKRNIPVWLVNGNKNNFLINAINNKIFFTKFEKIKN